MQLARDPVALASAFTDLTLGVFIFVAVALAIYLPGKYLAVPGARRAMDAAGVSDTWELSVLKVLKAGFALFAFVNAATLSGFTSFLQTTEAVVAAATIALGFAAQDVLSNFVSGVIIVTDPQYNIGDWIQWNGQEGVIEDISFRVTRVHTFDNELIAVPNAQLTKNAVTNPVAKDRLRIRQSFCVAYDTDVDHAKGVLVAAARANEDVLDRPAPSAMVAELADSCLELEVAFWIADPRRTGVVRTRSRYVQQVTEQFEAESIEMPYPTRELRGRVETGPAPTAGTLPREGSADPASGAGDDHADDL